MDSLEELSEWVDKSGPQTDAERDVLEAQRQRGESFQFNSTYSHNGYGVLVFLLVLLALPFLTLLRN